MLTPAQNSNKANCKIQDCFVNRQIKEDVKCNKLDYKNTNMNMWVYKHKYNMQACYIIHKYNMGTI
jgi:hypothetical protein